MWQFLLGAIVMLFGILIGFGLASVVQTNSTREIDNE